jgi:hypothetical protein
VVSARRRRAAVLAAALLAGAGCGDDLAPRSFVRDLRVLALVAEPLEAGPEDAVTVRAVALPPPGAALGAARWSFCPFTRGVTAAYACAVPECETPLVPDGTGAVRLEPGRLALACAARLAGAPGGPPAGIPADIPERLDTVVRYRIAAGGDEREAVQVVPLFPRGAPAERNAPPVLRALRVGGAEVSSGAAAPPLRPGGALEVRAELDPASAQRYLAEDGRTLVESLVVSFYTTAGRFDFDRASGPDARVQLEGKELAPGDAEAQLWAVARDLRGGATVAGPFTVPVVR